MILKGQNFRILVWNGDDAYKCVGMATSCTVTLTNNTEDGATKDDVGMAAKPITTSQGWSVQVESLDVTDAAAMLTAIKNLTPFTLKWDETRVSDNQGSEAAAFARQGQAYLNDATFTFNDRENSTKSLQFTGTSEITVGSESETEVISSSTYTKGQFVRLFLSSDNSAAPAKVIAAAKNLSLHVSMTLEDATTKDTPGTWQIQEPTGLSYDITTSALVRGNDTITSSVDAQDLASLESIYQAGTPVKWKIANVSGANQRTASSTICSGSCLLTQLTIQGPNRQNATYDAQLTGYGAYTVGA